MTMIKNGIIAVLLMITAVTASVAVGTYAAQRELERDYAFLEKRYVELFASTMQDDATGYMIPVND